MFDLFFSGAYVADTTRQTELFGPPPTIEAGLRRYLDDAGLLTYEQPR